MQPEDEITKEVQELLDSLEEHGRNARRQEKLSKLMEVENGKLSTLHAPLSSYLWWAVGAAAAMLLLWLLARPNMTETPDMNEEVLVEQTTININSDETEVSEAVLEETQTAQVEVFPSEKKAFGLPHRSTPLHEVLVDEQIAEDPLLAEAIVTEPSETNEANQLALTEETIEPEENTESNPTTIPNQQRRVIRSLNLVCFECQAENGKWETENSPLSTLHAPLEKTVFGQPQDPNMKNGSLAFEIKLN